jgi:hypothetical protein
MWKIQTEKMMEHMVTYHYIGMSITIHERINPLHVINMVLHLFYDYLELYI